MNVELNYEEVVRHTARELQRVIGMRSQGIWYDTDRHGNPNVETGCSVVPTRELIKIWENLTGRKYEIYSN